MPKPRTDNLDKGKVLPMTPVSHRKPCAGNPHARFEEGASAPGESEAECSTPPIKYGIWKFGCLEMTGRSISPERSENCEAISLEGCVPPLELEWEV